MSTHTSPILDAAKPSWEEYIVAAQGQKKTSERADGETPGQRLARFRRERGLTQAEVAERLGLSQVMISHYERGELRLHGELIIGLAPILGVSADELLGLSSPKRPSRSRDDRLWRRFNQAEKLSPTDRRQIAQLLDTFLDRAELRRQKA